MANFSNKEQGGVKAFHWLSLVN